MPLDIARIRALCFDVDGTLSDTDDQFVLRLVKILRPGSFLFPNRDPRPFARWAVMRTETPGNFVFALTDSLRIDGYLHHLGDLIYRAGLGHSPRPFLLIPGILEMLECLRGHYPMAIVSARGERSTLAFLEQFGLARYFDHIATAQTCRFTKPYPDPVLWAAQRMNVAPEACLMIGDTTVDIRTGKAAGAQTVGVLCGFGEREELKRCGADLVLEHTPDLVDLLLPQR